MSEWKVLLLWAGGREPNLADVTAFHHRISTPNWYNESVPDCRFYRGKSLAFTTGKRLDWGGLQNEICSLQLSLCSPPALILEFLVSVPNTTGFGLLLYLSDFFF